MNQFKKYFYTKNPTPLPLATKKWSLSQKFFGTSTFATFLLVFPVDEACNISNKYQLPSNLAKYQ